MPVVAFRPESNFLVAFLAAFLASKYESSRVPPRLKKTQTHHIFLDQRNILANVFLHKNSALFLIFSRENVNLRSYIWVKL